MSSPPQVFLAAADPSVGAERERVVRELESHGYSIVGDGPYPASPREALEQIRAELRASRLSIHLIGSRSTRVPLVLEQFNAALEHSSEARGFPQLIWLTRDGAREIATDELIASAFDRAGSGADVEVLRSGIEDFKTHITDRLESAGVADQRPAQHASGDRARVYLMYDRRDIDAAQAVEAFAERCGIDVIEPSFDADQVALRQHHQASLRTCDAAIIVYGRVAEPWVRMKQQDLVKAAGFGRDRPMVATAIFMAPEPTSSKDRFQASNISIIRSVDGLSVDAAAPFFERVQAGV